MAVLRRSAIVMRRADALSRAAAFFPDSQQGEGDMASRLMAALLAGAVSFGMAACGTTPGGRAVSGGLLGAGAGAGVSAVTGGNVGTGALVGGGVGAAGGALTAPRR
jgi:osmotically inducible lipoprotein OsmB